MASLHVKTDEWIMFHTNALHNGLCSMRQQCCKLFECNEPGRRQNKKNKIRVRMGREQNKQDMKIASHLAMLMPCFGERNELQNKQTKNSTIRTVQWLNRLLVKHRHKRSMAVDKPINRQPMVQHIRIRIPCSSQFVGPNLSHTIYCPHVDSDFAVCHYLSAFYRELPIGSIAVQHTNEMLIYVPAPWHRPLSPNLVN